MPQTGQPLIQNEPNRGSAVTLIYLDFMRFFAALGIILGHTSEFLVERSSRQSHHESTSGLTLFVDVFFILSGFVISYVYSDKVDGFRDFARYVQRRIARLYPLHLLTLFLMTALFFALVFLGINLNNPPNASAFCLASAVSLIHAWNSCSASVPNGVSWSISSEMSVYLLFPLLTQLARLRLLIAISAFVFIFAALSISSGSVYKLTSEYTAIRAIPPFYFGCLLYEARRHIVVGRWFSIVPIAMFFALIFGSYARLPREMLVVIAYALATSTIACDVGSVRPKFVARFHRLGDLSYSMYMLHPLIVAVLVSGLFDKVFRGGILMMRSSVIVAVSLILITSYFSLRYFEAPLRKKIDSLSIF